MFFKIFKMVLFLVKYEKQKTKALNMNIHTNVDLV